MSVVALGFFDGVHVGHRELIKKTVSEARRKGTRALVYTFSSHPSHFLNPSSPVKLIYSKEERERLLLSLGVDEVVFEDFERVKDFTPLEFVENVLVGELSAEAAVCGYNFRFGKGNSGDIDSLTSLLSAFGKPLFVIPPVCAEGEPVSSGRIRRLLEDGNVEKAGLFLYDNYHVSAPVVSGKHLGHSLGFPTANTELDSSAVSLKRGVYYTKTIYGTKEYLSVTNIGIRPTVNDGKTASVVETHLIDFDGEIYGEAITVIFYRFAREEKRFCSFEQLSQALRQDVEACEAYFKKEEKK